MNEATLISNSQRSKEQLREMGRKGGLASAKSRKERSDVRRALQILMETDLVVEDGQPKTGAEVIALKLVDMAMAGDIQAIKEINNRLYGQPKESIEAVIATDADKPDVPKGTKALYAKLAEMQKELAISEMARLAGLDDSDFAEGCTEDGFPNLSPSGVLKIARMKHDDD